MAAQRTLDPLILVRVRAPQLYNFIEMSDEDPNIDKQYKQPIYGFRKAPNSFFWFNDLEFNENT